MSKRFSFRKILNSFYCVLEQFPDKRTGDNTRYSMRDIALGAFSVFFTQSPSFLAHQTSLKMAKGKSNAETIFGINQIPSDNHIRDILDEVPPDQVFPIYHEIFSAYEQNEILDSFRSFGGTLLLPLDGVWYFSSKTLHCENCLTKNHQDGSTTYYHSAITPVIVSEGKNEVIPLPLEFIIPQDGQSKQDCELNAAKRWITQYAPRYSPLKVTLLGDDLYSRQPFCERVQEHFHFIFVCKPDSHKTLYEWIELLEEGKDQHTCCFRKWTGKTGHTSTYHYANQVPLRDSDDALMVNWCELTIQDDAGKMIYKNAWISDHRITEKNVVALVASARARWKIENENNNTLKTKGYHLKHNFGHGKKYLSATLATLNILAFAFHTLLGFLDENYRLLRLKLPTRKTFFDDIRALTRYLCFQSWEHLLEFMISGLEAKHCPDTS